MRILWLTNIILPLIADNARVQAPPTGGWISGILEGLRANNCVELFICFPYESKLDGRIKNIQYKSFISNQNLLEEFREILLSFKPDIVHIFGTEFKHSFDMVCAAEQCGLINSTIVNIQGLVSVCSRESAFFADIPVSIVNRNTVHDFLRKSSIASLRNKYENSGKYEKLVLKSVKHIIGRTDWDNACTIRINPSLKYHFCNETLRQSFYEKAGSWSVLKCERYSIFLTQCSYPIKGMHYAIEALHDIVQEYPGVHLYTVGKDPFNKSFNSKLKQTSYNKYLGELITKYNLKSYVSFLAPLNETEMCNRFLKSHVFLSASTIENESNSISEAKILGVPVVSSYVGGVTSRIRDKFDGFFYPVDEPYMCAYYIKQLFSNDELSTTISQNAVESALTIHDRQTNITQLLKIYSSLKQ